MTHGEAVLIVEAGDRLIARNTVVVYVRLLVTTVIGLLTARFVLQALGVSDYGLYGVVGGVLSLFAVIAGALSSTTIRFLNYEMGKPEGDPNRLFNICQVNHIAFAVIVLLLAETVGIFYILNYLNVEPGKAGDAMFVFQVSTLVTCVGIINVPYQSVFVAKERFLLIAVIDTINALVKLGLVILLLFYSGNALRFYAVIMTATTLISFVVYHYLCFRMWPGLVKWKFCNRFKEYKELLVFNNYTIMSAFALMGRSQGSNMLINFFFGTVVNGAFGIARTVQAFVESFTVNFDVAASPQITQSVGRGDLARASFIASRSCRMCQLLSLMVAFPLFVEVELLLRLWLGIVPEYTPLFCRVMLITIVVAGTGGGILRLKDALGKIKWFKITYSFWFLLTLPVGYVLYKMGYPPVTILVLYVIADVICRITQLALMKVIYDFDVKSFMRDAYTKPLIIAAIMVCYIMAYSQLDIATTGQQVLGFVVTGVIGTMMVLFLGLNRGEREKCWSYLAHSISR